MSCSMHLNGLVSVSSRVQPHPHSVPGHVCQRAEPERTGLCIGTHDWASLFAFRPPLLSGGAGPPLRESAAQSVPGGNPVFGLSARIGTCARPAPGW